MRLPSASKVLVFLLWFAVTSSTYAELLTFNVQWNGSGFGNSAAATGFITFDSTLLPEVGVQSFLPLPNAAVTDLAISITGSRGGNGTFGIGDFSSFYFSTPSQLNLTAELIGQPLTNGSSFGTSVGPLGDGQGGDFNLFGSGLAPSGTWYFQLTTAGGDTMLVTSMAPVPEPESYAMMLAGLVLLALGTWGRTRKNAGA